MYKTGLLVAVLLAVLTILEYIFAGEVNEATPRFIGLAATAVLKAGLIMYYFMHIYRLWRGEEAH
jgi:heme/copper-type cytochrome/quinol oxidase subunit 4